MKNQRKFLSGVLCLLMVAFCAFALVACNGDDECSHKWGGWTVKTGATCTETGVQERKCSECGKTETSTVDALGHTWKDATCTAPKTCTVCQATEGSAISHTPSADDGDCTTAITCSVCGEVTTPAKGSHAGGTATCKEKAKCEVCGKEYGEFAAHTPNADDGDCTTAITCFVCGDVTTPAKASHTGGTATCQAKAVCSVCNTVYGDYGVHSYDETTWGYKAAEGHAHMCSVAGCNAHDTVVGHISSGAATETTAEKCAACGYVINPALGHKTHTPASAWSNNAIHHWHECIGCEEQEFNKAEHTYDNSCDTTCNVCGYTRTVTHSYTVVKQDAEKHWYECAICHATKPNSTEAHKGGTATCQHKAECSVCGNEYGNFGAHRSNADDGDCTTAITCSVCGEVTTTAKAHAFDNACDTTCNNANCGHTRVISHTPNADDGDCTTAITCSVCGEVTTPAKANHTGGTATCEHKAECTVCGKEYGNLAAHTPNADDGDCTTAITCSVCGDVTIPGKPSHTGGTANCQHKAECSVCGKEYGDFGVHTPNVDDGDCTTEITCSVCGDVTTPAKATHTGGTATCKDKAECTVCGKAYGNLVAHTPNADDGDCTTAITCSVCGEVTTPAKTTHTGGTSTCEYKAECTVCGKEYGDLAAHTPNADDGDCTTAITCSVCGEITTIAKTHAFDNACDKTCNNVNCVYTRVISHTSNADDGDCTTAITCSVCGTVTTPARATHTGGTATCEHKAECTICGKEYGNLAAHISNNDDGDCTTAITCSVCGVVTTPAKPSHTGGTANCQHKAECSVCGKEYSDLGVHTPNPDDGDCTTAITCSVCNEVTTPAKTHTFDNDLDADCNNENCDYTRTVEPVATYTVTFYDYDGTTVLATRTNVAEGGNAAIPANPTKTGATFLGWKGTYTNITKDESVVAVYSDSKNVFTVESATGTVGTTLTLLVDVNGAVKTCGFDMTIYYDNSVLELISYDSDLDLDVIVNDSELSNGVLLNFSAATDKTKQRDIISLTFTIKSTTQTATEVTIAMTSAKEIDGQAIIDTEYTLINGVVTIQ